MTFISFILGLRFQDDIYNIFKESGNRVAVAFDKEAQPKSLVKCSEGNLSEWKRNVILMKTSAFRGNEKENEPEKETQK